MYQRLTSTENAAKLPIDQDAWMLHQFEDHEVVRLHLDPGECMENHVNEWRIIFYVLRGTGSLEMEGRSNELNEGQSIAVEPGLERSWSNTGKKVLELLAIKTREQL